MKLKTKFHVRGEHLASQAGFTLIELMVVISIISLLSSIILVTVYRARVNGRDARRLSDLQNVQTALELYYNTYNHYPITTCSGPNASSDGWVTPNGTYGDYPNYGICDVVGGPITSSGFNTAMANFIYPLRDPLLLNTDPITGYWYKSNGTEYKFQIYATPENMNNFPIQFVDPAICGLPILSNGTCGTHGYQESPLGGYYWSNTASIWTSGWSAVYPQE